MSLKVRSHINKASDSPLAHYGLPWDSIPGSTSKLVRGTEARFLKSLKKVGRLKGEEQSMGQITGFCPAQCDFLT